MCAPFGIKSLVTALAFVQPGRWLLNFKKLNVPVLGEAACMGGAVFVEPAWITMSTRSWALFELATRDLDHYDALDLCG